MTDMRLAIKGVGVAGGFGVGLDELRQALISGECIPQIESVETEEGSAEMPVFLCDTTPLERFASKRALRRVDHYSRLGLLGAYLALEDAGLLQTDLQDLAVVLASGYGATRTTFAFLDSVMDDGDACASPILFSNSVHNAAAAHISMSLKAQGPNVTVSQFEMSAHAGLLTASQWLAEKWVDLVLFGCIDEYCTVLGYSWQRFFGQVHDSHIRPFQWNRQSAIAGEGSAFLLLSAEEAIHSRYGFITDIKLGNLGQGGLLLPDNALLFLNADGHRKCGRQYARHIARDVRVASYTPLYGSSPVGSAFDIAIAADSIKNDRLYGSPKRGRETAGLRIICEEQELDTEQIICLKLGCNGEFGMVTLTRE